MAVSPHRPVASIGSQLLRALIAAGLVLLCGVLVYRLVGLTAPGALVFALGCGVIRLILFPLRR